MKKILLAVLALVLVWSAGSYFYMSKNVWLSTVEANPDYICKKAVIDSPCEIVTCDPWKTDGTRTCNWNKTTEVSYYLVRKIDILKLIIDDNHELLVVDKLEIMFHELKVVRLLKLIMYLQFEIFQSKFL